MPSVFKYEDAPLAEGKFSPNLPLPIPRPEPSFHLLQGTNDFAMSGGDVILKYKYGHSYL